MAKHDKIDVGLSTILNPVPVVMVSCGDKEGRANILTIAWTGTVNSEPPMVTISVRKSRFSHKMISETGEFVINLVNKSLCKACDRCGVVSGENEDKFESCSLTAVKASGLSYAYAIKEAPVASDEVFEKRMGFSRKDRDKYKHIREQGDKNGKKY